MPEIKTVKVKTDDGFAIINESDFDEKTMKLFDGKEKAAPKKRKTKG